MTFQDIQSVIQLAAALNAIYLSLKEISTPHIEKEDRMLKLITSDLRILRSSCDVSDAYNELSSYMSTFQDFKSCFYQRDFRVMIAVTVATVTYICILIISSVGASSDLPIIAGLYISLMGFIPIGWGLIEHVLVESRISSEIKPKRRKVEAMIAEAIDKQPNPAASPSGAVNRELTIDKGNAK